ncbi:hypothetical protein, partial, partial [Absidia glauca]
MRNVQALVLGKMELQQRGRPVSAYAAEFLRLSSDLNWDEQALCALFYRGLNGNVKDELCTRDRPDNLTSLTEICIRLDARLYERRSERERDAYQHRTNPRWNT